MGINTKGNFLLIDSFFIILLGISNGGEREIWPDVCFLTVRGDKFHCVQNLSDILWPYHFIDTTRSNLDYQYRMGGDQSHKMDLTLTKLSLQLIHLFNRINIITYPWTMCSHLVTVKRFFFLETTKSMIYGGVKWMEKINHSIQVSIQKNYYHYTV